MIRNLIRGIITISFGALGFYVNYILDQARILQSLGWTFPVIWTYVAMVLVFAIGGFLISPASIRGFLTLMNWLDARLTKIPTHDLMGGAIGVIIGLIISSLFSNAIESIPVVGSILSILISITL